MYHFTDAWTLVTILNDNILNIGYFDHPTEIGDTKMLSLTRDINFRLDHRDNEVIICLDKNKLINNYKITPYDFYIKTNKEFLKKWELDRIRYENEEILYKKIKDLNKYILYIKFIDTDVYNEYERQISEYVKKYKIKIVK